MVRTATASLDRTSEAPLWVQLRLLLKGQIESGVFAPGDQLPSEADLCERFNVSRTVVREALGQLVVDGRIYKVKGRGAFVSGPKGEGEFVGRTMGFWDEMAGKGRQVRTRVLDLALREPLDRERSALRLDGSGLVVGVRRVYMLDGTPALLVRTALPAALVPGLERTNLENRSLYQAIRQRYGLVPHSAERWIEATLPNPEEATQLGIDASTPLLGIESIASLQGGTPMEYYYALQRTDDTRLHVTSR
jgi:GntR family transcriptional regulator